MERFALRHNARQARKIEAQSILRHMCDALSSQSDWQPAAAAEARMAGRGAPSTSTAGARPPHCTMASAATAAHQQRLLRALSYPFDYASDGDAASLATLVTWCEDRKIRALEIDDRAPLRVAGERWDGAFAAYLAELDCPGSWPRDRDACVSWLLWKAVTTKSARTRSSS